MKTQAHEVVETRTTAAAQPVVLDGKPGMLTAKARHAPARTVAGMRQQRGGERIAFVGLPAVEVMNAQHAP